jgi:hypothetical protein
MGSSYVSSNASRLYLALETRYGAVPEASQARRIPLVRLSARQEFEVPKRRDKTGTRTFSGAPSGLRRRTSYDLNTYMADWDLGPGGPRQDALFQAAMGGVPEYFPGTAAAAGCTAQVLRLAEGHTFFPGQALTFEGEIRFVKSIVDGTTVEINAPLSTVPPQGAPLGPTMTYRPGSDLPSASLFEYWDPISAVQRVLCGGAVEKFSLKVNGDLHEFRFAGIGKDLLDSASFVAGQGDLEAFPFEPGSGEPDYAIIPGHLGQAWIGSAPTLFPTLTGAELTLENGVETREREFGSELPRCLSPGPRSVKLGFEIYEQDDAATAALYQAARQRSPVEAMLQLGQCAGQLFGVHLTSVVPEMPEFDDSDVRLQWRFAGSRAQGSADTEITIAFG